MYFPGAIVAALISLFHGQLPYRQEQTNQMDNGSIGPGLFTRLIVILSPAGQKVEENKMLECHDRGLLSFIRKIDLWFEKKNKTLGEA